MSALLLGCCCFQALTVDRARDACIYLCMYTYIYNYIYPSMYLYIYPHSPPTEIHEFTDTANPKHRVHSSFLLCTYLPQQWESGQPLSSIYWHTSPVTLYVTTFPLLLPPLHVNTFLIPFTLWHLSQAATATWIPFSCCSVSNSVR